jgi:hypothetical protein
VQKRDEQLLFRRHSSSDLSQEPLESLGKLQANFSPYILASRRRHVQKRDEQLLFRRHSSSDLSQEPLESLGKLQANFSP